MPDIRQGAVPTSFFRERRATAYNFWRLAFWREALQNSVDAGASCVNIAMEDVLSEPFVENGGAPEGAVRVTIQDNGCGMDLDTVETVFFQLGRSTKRTDEGAIGGFGTARMLLCFSHLRYEIRSGDMRIQGCGLSYIVSSLAADGMPPVRGCTFIIDVALADTGADGLLGALRSVMARSAPRSVRVELNGEALAFGVSAGPRLKYIKATVDGGTVPFATVRYAADKAAGGGILVRQSGIWMFSRSASLKRTVIVDLDQAHARRALNETRESLRGVYADAFNAFAEGIATESMSGLKADTADTIALFHGEKGLQRFSLSGPGSAVSFAGNGIKAGVGTIIRVVPKVGSAPGGGGIGRDAPTGVVPVPGTHSLMILSRDIKGNHHLARARRRFYPKNWKGKKPAPLVLLNAWNIACTRAIEALQCVRPSAFSEEAVIRPGFLFEPSEGVHEGGEWCDRRTGVASRMMWKLPWAASPVWGT